MAQVLSVVKSLAEKSWGKVMQTDHIGGTLYETIYSVIHKQGDKQGDRQGDIQWVTHYKTLYNVIEYDVQCDLQGKRYMRRCSEKTARDEWGRSKSWTNDLKLVYLIRERTIAKCSKCKDPMVLLNLRSKRMH